MNKARLSFIWNIFKPVNNSAERYTQWYAQRYYGCNCKNRSTCLLDNKCLTPSIVYRAIVSAINKPDKKYFGISETPFKDRYNNHTRDFRHKEYVNSTELSKYIWKLKDEGEINSFNNMEYNVCCQLPLCSDYLYFILHVCLPKFQFLLATIVHFSCILIGQFHFRCFDIILKFWVSHFCRDIFSPCFQWWKIGFVQLWQSGSHFWLLVWTFYMYMLQVKFALCLEINFLFLILF